MAKIRVTNETKIPFYFRYEAIDGTHPLEHAGVRKSIVTIKPLRPHTYVIVGAKTQQRILYEGIKHRTLAIQEIGNTWELAWQ